MRSTNIPVFNEALSLLRQANRLLDNTDAGVCLIHLDACVAALESRLRREGVTPQPVSQAADNDVTRSTDEPGSQVGL